MKIIEFMRVSCLGLRAWAEGLASRLVTFPPPRLGWVVWPAPAQITPGRVVNARTAGQYGGDRDVRALGRTHRDGMNGRVQDSIRRRGDFG